MQRISGSSHPEEGSEWRAEALPGSLGGLGAEAQRCRNLRFARYTTSLDTAN